MSNMFQFKSAILYYGIQSIFGPNFSYLEYSHVLNTPMLTWSISEKKRIYQGKFSKMFLPKQFINYRSNEYCINVNGDEHIFEYEIFNTKNINKCFSGKMFLIIKNRKTFENKFYNRWIFCSINILIFKHENYA